MREIVMYLLIYKTQLVAIVNSVSEHDLEYAFTDMVVVRLSDNHYFRTEFEREWVPVPIKVN